MEEYPLNDSVAVKEQQGKVPVHAFGKMPSRSDLPSRSFKEALAGKSNSVFKNSELECSSFRGMPAFLISDEAMNQLAAPYEFTLVGKFTVKRPPLDIIRKFFYNLKLSGSFSVSLMDYRHIAIQLTNDLDYSRIFAHRSYYVSNCQMKLLKWTPFFDIKEESPIVPVWICFPNLRLHLINHHIIHALASVYGRPLQTDQATAAKTRPSMARVLVEMDVSIKHPTEIWIGSELNGYAQQVELENFPLFCSQCKLHGHMLGECNKLHHQVKTNKPPTKTVFRPKIVDAGTNTDNGKSVPIIVNEKGGTIIDSVDQGDLNDAIVISNNQGKDDINIENSVLNNVANIDLQGKDINGKSIVFNKEKYNSYGSQANRKEFIDSFLMEGNKLLNGNAIPLPHDDIGNTNCNVNLNEGNHYLHSPIISNYAKSLPDKDTDKEELEEGEVDGLYDSYASDSCIRPANRALTFPDKKVDDDDFTIVKRKRGQKKRYKKSGPPRITRSTAFNNGFND